MTIDEMPLDKRTINKLNVDDTLDKMALNEMTLDKKTVDEMNSGNECNDCR